MVKADLTAGARASAANNRNGREPFRTWHLWHSNFNVFLSGPRLARV